MPIPWSLAFARKYRKHLSIGGLLRYRRAHLQEKAGRLGYHDVVTVRMRRPVRQEIALRPASNDCYTFDEIFVEQVYAEVVRAVPAAATVIDLGANIGFASLYFAAHYPGCRLYCVEPDSENFGLLRRNLRPLIESSRCMTLQAAIWDSGKPLRLAPLEKGHVNQFTTREADVGDPAATTAGVTMQEVLKLSGFDRVDVLKVDVEGAETRVFSGDMRWLERVGALAVEFHDGSRGACPFDEAMRTYGFRVSEHGHTVVAVRERYVTSPLGEPTQDPRACQPGV